MSGFGFGGKSALDGIEEVESFNEKPGGGQDSDDEKVDQSVAISEIDGPNNFLEGLENDFEGEGSITIDK